MAYGQAGLAHDVLPRATNAAGTTSSHRPRRRRAIACTSFKRCKDPSDQRVHRPDGPFSSGTSPEEHERLRGERAAQCFARLIARASALSGGGSHRRLMCRPANRSGRRRFIPASPVRRRASSPYTMRHAPRVNAQRFHRAVRLVFVTVSFVAAGHGCPSTSMYALLDGMPFGVPTVAFAVQRAALHASIKRSAVASGGLEAASAPSRHALVVRMFPCAA